MSSSYAATYAFWLPQSDLNSISEAMKPWFVVDRVLSYSEGCDKLWRPWSCRWGVRHVHIIKTFWLTGSFAGLPVLKQHNYWIYDKNGNARKKWLVLETALEMGPKVNYSLSCNKPVLRGHFLLSTARVFRFWNMCELLNHSCARKKIPTAIIDLGL